MMSAKMVLGLLNTYGSRDQSDGVIYQHLLSRGISGVSFCFIPCAEQIFFFGGGVGGGLGGGRGVHFKQVIACWSICLLVC